MLNNWIYLWDDNWMALSELNMHVMSLSENNIAVWNVHTDLSTTFKYYAVHTVHLYFFGILYWSF